jgi:hypothetical protein
VNDGKKDGIKEMERRKWKEEWNTGNESKKRQT